MEEREVYGASEETTEDYLRLAEKLERLFDLLDGLQEENTTNEP